MSNTLQSLAARGVLHAEMLVREVSGTSIRTETHVRLVEQKIPSMKELVPDYRFIIRIGYAFTMVALG